MSHPSVSQARHEDIQILCFRGDLRHTLAPAVYRFVDQLLAADAPRGFVIDLSKAVGIDSTCLGLLAHIAQHMQRINDSRVCLIVSESDVLTSLLHVGFDEVFDIVDHCGGTPPEVQPLTLDEMPEREALLEAMLTSHRTLMALNDKNKAVFADVVKLLEAESGGD